MTFVQTIVFVVILIVGVVWILSVLSRPVSVENKESIERTIITAMAMVSRHGGMVSITYTRGGLSISYYPDDDEEEEDEDESVQDGD